MADGGGEFRGVVREGNIVEWTFKHWITKPGVIGPPDQVVIGNVDRRGCTEMRGWDFSYVRRGWAVEE